MPRSDVVLYACEFQADVSNANEKNMNSLVDILTVTQLNNIPFTVIYDNFIGMHEQFLRDTNIKTDIL